MQQDIRVSQRNKIEPTHILLSTGSTRFCINIVNKYAFKTKLSNYLLLDYLLQKKSSSSANKSIKNIFSSVGFNFNLLQKQFKNYSFVQQILHQKYANTVDRKNNIFHNQKLIQKKVTKKGSRELQVDKEDHIIYIDKQKIIFQPIQSVITKDQKMFTSFSTKDLLFYNQELIQKNMIKKQNSKLLMDKNQNILINHQTRIEPYKQRNTDQDRSLKETSIIYAVDQNRVPPQEVSSHTTKTNAIEMKNNNQSITVEKTAKNINHYEIKQLAKKVYPLVMKQWQKEFERRGVFYG